VTGVAPLLCEMETTFFSSCQQQIYGKMQF